MRNDRSNSDFQTFFEGFIYMCVCVCVLHSLLYLSAVILFVIYISVFFFQFVNVMHGSSWIAKAGNRYLPLWKCWYLISGEYNFQLDLQLDVGYDVLPTCMSCWEWTGNSMKSRVSQPHLYVQSHKHNHFGILHTPTSLHTCIQTQFWALLCLFWHFWQSTSH